MSNHKSNERYFLFYPIKKQQMGKQTRTDLEKEEKEKLTWGQIQAKKEETFKKWQQNVVKFCKCCKSKGKKKLATKYMSYWSKAMDMNVSYYFCEKCCQAQDNRQECECLFDCPHHSCECDWCELRICQDERCKKCLKREQEEEEEERLAEEKEEKELNPTQPE